MGHNYRLWEHPNFRFTNPKKGETLVEYTLRITAHLISPPHYVGESVTIECDDVAEQVLELKDRIQKKWDKANPGRL